MYNIKCTLDVTKDGVFLARKEVTIKEADVSQVAPVIRVVLDNAEQQITYDVDTWEMSERHRREREKKKRADFSR